MEKMSSSFLLNGQSEDMKLKRNSLDLIIIMGSLEHVVDVNFAMKNVLML